MHLTCQFTMSTILKILYTISILQIVVFIGAKGQEFTAECPDPATFQLTNISCTESSDCAADERAAVCAPVVTNVCFCLSDSFGYALNPNTSQCDIQINECACGYDLCAQNCTDLDPAVSINASAYECSCLTGYVLSNLYNCDDIDECTENSTVCGLTANSSTCDNTPGSYVCNCSGSGWTDIGNYCEDVNECNSSPCNSTCTNNEGSFVCSCPTGYELNGDGLNCDQIDECARNTDNCNQTCTDTPGSFECSCSSGYFLDDDGFSCTLQTCPENEICAIQYDVRIAIREYWISDLYVNNSETFVHAAASLEEQFRAGFALNNQSWILDHYELLRFDLRSSDHYFAYLNITIEDSNATVGSRTDSYIEAVIIAGMETLNTSQFVNPINVTFDTFEIIRGMVDNVNVVLTCTNLGMIVQIDESQFTEGVSSANLTLKDPACSFTKTGQTWEASFEYNNCGVVREEFSENGTIRYTQFVLYGDVESIDFPESNLAYVNARSHIITLECNYRVSEAFGTELEFFDPEVVDAVGSFNVSLLLYESDDFSQVVTTYPWYVEDGSTLLAFEAKLDTGDTQLGIYLDECWAAPSSDIYDQDKVSIMANGCADDTDFTWVGQVNDMQSVRFTYVAHKFVNRSRGMEALDETYYFCYYEICDKTEGYCLDKLTDWLPGCSADRSKRSSGSSSNLAGIISIRVNFLPENATAQPISEDEELLSDAALASVLAIVAMIVASSFLVVFVMILRFQNAAFARYFETLRGQHQQSSDHRGSGYSSNTWGSNNTVNSATMELPRLKAHHGY
ncbi:uncharacterized protein LOC142352004 isoform X1 [Convolutriloba macropyga]|uniref:uncharacterized protein LOC142352004 isoform X1 n=1 Tax=Convolutriloba macropyga TaxID=536237 RepID=UPI003F51C682